MADELGILSERSGRTVSGSSAIYAPAEGGWSARVRPLTSPGRSSYPRFHIAIVDPTGTARYVCQAIAAHEAVGERLVMFKVEVVGVGRVGLVLSDPAGMVVPHAGCPWSRTSGLVGPEATNGGQHE